MPPDVPGRKPGAGGEVTVQIGPEVYSPVKYNSFTVGPVRVTLPIEAGKSAMETYSDASKLAAAMYKVELREAIERYTQGMRVVTQEVRSAAGPR